MNCELPNSGEAEERPADNQAEAHGPHLAQGHQAQVPRRGWTRNKGIEGQTDTHRFRRTKKYVSLL